MVGRRELPQSGSLSDVRWKGPTEEEFTSTFRRAIAEFRNGTLRKIVPVTFEEAEFSFSEVVRRSLASHAVHGADDLMPYGIWSDASGMIGAFDALEFLALLSCHIPKPYESVTRYYGWYSCRRRGERAKHAPVPDKSDTQEQRTEPSVSWAACMKRVFEIDPLECPRCKSQMRMVAFLTNDREILKIADALRIPLAQAPPKIPRPPQLEYFDHFPPDDFSA